MKTDTASNQDFQLQHRIEFHRHAIALMPTDEDVDAAVAYEIQNRRGRVGSRVCSCKAASKRSQTCRHLKELSRASRLFEDREGHPNMAASFTASPWYSLAQALARNDRQPVESIQIRAMAKAGEGSIEILGHDGRLRLVYHSTGSDRDRFMQRFRLKTRGQQLPTRAEVLGRLAMMTQSDDERLLLQKGLKTWRQIFEDSLWHRFAYHGFKEFGSGGCRFKTAIASGKGSFRLIGVDGQGFDLFTVSVSRSDVEQVLTTIGATFLSDAGPTIGPYPLRTFYHVGLNASLALEIRPMLELSMADGTTRIFDKASLAPYRYGNLYYLDELDMLLSEIDPAKPPAFAKAAPMVIPKQEVPYFLAEHATELGQDRFRLVDSVKALKICDTYDRIDISSRVLERDWLWLSVEYGCGDQRISLAEVLGAKRREERFISTGGGWVDSRAEAFDPLDELVQADVEEATAGAEGAIRLRRTDLLRLAADRQLVTLKGQGRQREALENLLDLKPAEALPPLTGLTSTLRNYQLRGTEWLWFLYENHFGGLLCDDMGLGKTHQVMAFAVGLKQAGRMPAPLLIVCPTSVLSHWEQKLSAHAPGITAAVHHGPRRNLGRALEEADLLITSYGVMRSDREILKTLSFSVAVFDEIQHIKNKQTHTYKAAQELRADLKIGLTGTPIENSLSELKALMDLTVPGYLGADSAFSERFLVPIEQYNDAAKRLRLRRIISPFTLRRLKRNVLTELPPKIEDIRTCRLSDEQLKLYQDAIAARGRHLAQELSDQETPVPYMHIFALLNMLKQICDHPALLEEAPADGGNGRSGDHRSSDHRSSDHRSSDHRSGKWALFCELLDEALDSGQKVVVYSQYLKMIDIIKDHLSGQGVDFVALTGASRNRGRLIRRFNDDPDCRVFVGSLKAGGVGIDLVAASVVIHYDRWWNAAKEDQATDRVHRIGQTRGVQVFKLLTRGTLEEKIAAIIAKKSKLMESIVKEDDPSLLKSFSREDLLAMLAVPEEGGGASLRG
ncbi:MAG: DEAD/DEAH box helicase [Desulfosarcinaceae bacterium]